MERYDPSIYLQLQEVLHDIRQKSLHELSSLANDLLPPDHSFSALINSLDPTHRTLALKASLLVYFASKCKIVPRQYQLEANNALEDGRDVLIDSGTGSGKTLCQIIPNLMHPTTMSITISPLKSPETTTNSSIFQVAELQRWGINAISINEDTPNDVPLWNHIRDGYFQHLIVQPEQLQSFHGHLPRLARLMNGHSFAKKIARVHIDEAHFHVTAGLPHYGLSAFRPAWGALNEFRLRLPKGTPIQALSGTQPPHIKSAIINHLNFDPATFLSLKLSTNRPNIIYATHRIVGSVSDFRNLDFLVSTPFTHIIKTIIYHDDTQWTADAANYHDQRLSEHLRHTGIVRHYHGGMSKQYLQEVFDDFCNPSGSCKLLHATEGASTGLHVDDVLAVVDYGLPQHKLTALQRGGRCGRKGQKSVYLVMAEPWAYSASLEAVDPSSSDPDRPISGRLTKTSRKPARAGLAMVLYVRSTVCLREMIARYLAGVSSQALEIATEWCCDLDHPDQPTRKFDKRTFFPGRFIYADDKGGIFAGDTDEPDRVHLNPPKAKKRKAKGTSNRKVVERQPLQLELQNWLASAYASDPLRSVRPATFILDPKSIKALSTVHPNRIKVVSDVVSTLDETEEWEMEWGHQLGVRILDQNQSVLKEEMFLAGSGQGWMRR
ncbi:P-loop containing nucleoside triphosphate hydrolase protein [Mycena pura]|uniref:DNA 3'-5' helicase n=1 Tax=Mycena pura TaxID=153505 RepID=A0AAD7E1E4_9AGAR|nr:P-loop containing nucleoside triphosphate hydrolase protein [Mycena pura]